MKFNKKSFLFVVLIAVLVQTLVITYNQFTGYIFIKSFLEAVVRLAVGTAFSAAAGVLLLFIDNSIITVLDHFSKWEDSLINRSIIEIIVVFVTGGLLGFLITVTAQVFFPYKEELESVIIRNVTITIIVNSIFTAVLEAVIIFRRNIENRYRAEQLEKENSFIRFETLINQLNPHFLFNSLNVLSALIRKDSDKAQNFIDEFSSIYRYTLDVISKQVVTVGDEMNYSKSYLYLQQIRFGDALKTEISIKADKLNCLLPPLSMQVVLENALKHNRVSHDFPLTLKIYDEGEYLVITNKLQPKISHGQSGGIGLENLMKRYNFVSRTLPEFTLTQNEYIAKLPIIIPQ